MPPKISVIIVVFNGAKTLPQAIESVLRQTYKNVELIVVDGGSTDGTLDILRKYESNNFIWKSEPDKGIYDAMNKGIMMAHGEWLHFLGADDTLINDKVLENVFNENLPPAISNMFSFQKKIPFSILRIGVFSKFFMLISYCLNVMKTMIK
jgi:glycosyltransferase involved in cell wall biosynthesis